ncbi:MAG: ComF family protein [Ruminococcaceae bacterium]|nr:ComF family protein [Oscillospiraceae bacterium]
MNIKEISDRVLFALSVPKCVCCREPIDYGQKAFCPKCSADFEEIKTRNCSRCAKKLNACSCSNEYLEGHFIKRVVKCFRYLVKDEINPANALIFSMKKDNRKDVLEVCTQELVAAIRNSVDNPEEYIITNIPRRKAEIIDKGLDQAELLARAIATRLGAEYMPILKSLSKKSQKTLERADRLKNANFAIKSEADLTGKSVIIVDDVITTGASMGTAAALIRSLGAKNITAAALGIAYRDKYDFADFNL